jgi:hypothetical protein
LCSFGDMGADKASVMSGLQTDWTAGCDNPTGARCSEADWGVVFSGPTGAWVFVGRMLRRHWLSFGEVGGGKGERLA